MAYDTIKRLDEYAFRSWGAIADPTNKIITLRFVSGDGLKATEIVFDRAGAEALRLALDDAITELEEVS